MQVLVNIRKLVTLALFIGFCTAVFVAIRSLINPERGLSIKREKRAKFPCITLCPSEYLSQVNDSSFVGYQSLPKIQDYIDFALDIQNIASEGFKFYDLNNATAMDLLGISSNDKILVEVWRLVGKGLKRCLTLQIPKHLRSNKSYVLLVPN